VIATAASVLLGLVFLVAGASKVAIRHEWPAQAARLGAPVLVVPIVPWWEIVVGALLVVGLGAPWPAAVAAATLVLFTVLLVGVLRRGEHPPCACFGGFSARPLGWGQVARNGGFLALAVVAVAAA
jgi:uncharacterized membrane protein YphA (DoxX/SURF4 family)